MNKRIISLALAVIMFMMSSVMYYDVQATVNLGDISVDRITYRKIHNGYEISGSIIEIWGTDVNDATILFEDSVQGFQEDIGTKETDIPGLVRYSLTQAETLSFAGSLAIEGQTFPLGVNTFPNFSDADENVYNVDDSPVIQLTGANLDRLDTDSATITATYGNLERETIVYDGTSPDPNDIDTPTLVKIPNPNVPGGILGNQNIQIEENDTATASNGESFDKRIIYVYNNAFRLVEDLVVTNPVLFPNTGAKNDLFYITAEDLNPNKNYQAYFITDTSQPLSDDNRATFVSLAVDYDGSDDRLTFRVPNGSDFPELEYFVVLADVQNNSIIAQMTLSDKFSVVDADYLPSITEIYPTFGPEEGADVQIDGRNLISLNVPDLDTSGANPVLTQDSDGLHIVYDNGTYDGKSVSIRKDIITKIGGKVTYQTSGSAIRYEQSTGADGLDSLYVEAPPAADAETDPYKDVNMQITITMEVLSGPDTGTIYTLFQVVNLENGFRYIPSSITPTITSVTPDTVHVTGTAGNYTTGDDVMLVIDGSNFLVNRYTDNNGNVYTNYPTIYIKTLNDQSENNYDIALKPNVTVNGVKGVVYDMRSPISGGLNYMPNSDNTAPHQLELKVVNSDGEVVTGATNNDVGTRIIARIPRGANVDLADFKNILIVNPKRNSQQAGHKLVAVDAFRIVDTNDIPIIESVIPNVVTVDGDEDIVVTGHNFQQGARLFLDGNEITNFTRDISQSGEKIILTFNAPAGPAGRSQIIIQNPSGAVATQDFYYVVSFNADPVITNFMPPKGTAGTYVTINGENYLKPDPTVESAVGLDALRLIGTRIFLDGEEINQYNQDSEGNVLFETYDAPDAIDFITEDVVGQRYVLTPFSKNIVVKSVEGSNTVIYELGNDGDGNPMLFDDNDNTYTFKYETDRINVYKNGSTLLGSLEDAGVYTYTQNADTTIGTATINLDNKVFTITQNNNILFIGDIENNMKEPRMADYAESVILFGNTSPVEYFRVYRDFDTSIHVTNGRDKNYVIEYDQVGDKLVARQSESEVYDIININDEGFTIDTATPITLRMNTAFQTNNVTNEIVGHFGKVMNRSQLSFEVPVLTSGRGYKDLKVVNPDTKYAEKTGDDGFYYIDQASSNPRIVSISPNEGATAGGYSVVINGQGFEQNMTVYVDGVMVPPTDTTVALDGNSVQIIMPACTKDLAEDYDVSELSVAVVVLNNDGGTDHKADGFKYIIPKSSPRIDQLLPGTGSTNGGDIVEIIGYEFRYFEPYNNLVGGPEYNIGDTFQDLYKDNLWTNLKGTYPAGAIVNEPFVPPHAIYNTYLVSPVLPRVFFGTQEAKIVEFDTGYLKVITPQNLEGTKKVYVLNNDAGISNKVDFEYVASNPVISSIIPPHGKRQGLETRDFLGSNFYEGVYEGYINDDDTTIATIPNLDGQVRFTDITNRSIAREQPNSGLINAQRATVNLEGELRVEYNGSANTIRMSITENGNVYSRVFNNYNDGVAFLPMEMLKTSTGQYYHPNNTDSTVHDGTTYENLVFEYIKVEVFDRRFLVDRSYAPRVDFLSGNHLQVTTSSYHTIGETTVLFTNPDGGTTTADFRYTFPASSPKIYQVLPRVLSADGTKYLTKRSVSGNTQIEILGTDFRDDIVVQIGTTNVTVSEKTVMETVVDGNTVSLDLLIVDVPAGTLNQVGLEQSVYVTNTDYGTANSSNAMDILGTDKKPMYFVYQQPLSNPEVASVEPERTSQFGGNTVTLRGSDFRVGATVTIGTNGGIPITTTTVSEQGTKLVFTTPQNSLVPGDKPVQVENEDFGTSGIATTIQVVSYPIVNETIRFADGSVANWISVEGNQRIKITGQNFYEGAKVIFGGTRTDDAPGLVGEKGLFKDDTMKNVANGVLAPSVEFVSNTELIVTTPLMEYEDPYTITVLNADGGISDNNRTVNYSVPVPTNPVGLRADLIDNRYIKISEYTASNHNYYEVYYFIGNKSTSNIEDDDYIDMTYLTSTEIEPFRLPAIRGIDSMKPYEKLVIGLKAVNSFGSSDWSNLVYLTFEDLREVEEYGDPDIDGDLGVPADKDFISEVIGTKLVTTLNENSPLSYIYIDLSTPNYDDLETRIVNVPGDMIKQSQAIVRIDYKDLDIQFAPIALNTKVFQSLSFGEKPYGRIESTSIEDAYSGYMLNQVPRGYKVVSKVITVGFDARNNSNVEKVEVLSGSLDLQMSYDEMRLGNYAESSIEMYRFDKVTNTWTKIDATLNEADNLITGRTNLSGAYVLMLKR